MANIFIINGYQPNPFGKGKLNASLVEQAKTFFSARGDQVRVTEVDKDYDIETELKNHEWADVILMQYPINWMSVSWGFKKYLDEVYTAGIGGRLSNGDGRTAAAFKDNYGGGGLLKDKAYMMSVTLNAPDTAFNAPEAFFEGKSIDTLLWPMHLNAKFLGMKPLPTFAAFDVVKNPEIDQDFVRFDEHLKTVF